MGSVLHAAAAVLTFALLGTLTPRSLAAQGNPVLARPMPPGDSAAAVEVLRRTRAWHNSIMRVDTAALRRILLPEFSLTLPPELERAHVTLEAYLRNTGGYQLKEDRWEASDVRILGEVAVVTSRYWQRATPGGRDRSGTFLLTDVWRRVGGEWRVATRWSTWLDAPARVPAASAKTPAP